MIWVMSVQDSLESQLDKMLADHRPCHYAVQNGSGQVDWVPKHTPCWFEAKSGKLIIDTANDSRCEAQPSSLYAPERALSSKTAMAVSSD